MLPKSAVNGEMAAGSLVAKPAVFHTSICKAPSLPKCVVVHWQHRHCLSICRSNELPEAIILVCAARSLANWGQGTVQAQVAYKTQALPLAPL
jgi:hypothetical protein